MKLSTYVPVSVAANGSDNGPTTAHTRKSSPDATTVQTYALKPDTSAILLSVETTSARVTLDGSDPSAASAPSLVFPTGLFPGLIPVGPGTTIKHVSTAGTASVLQICELT